MIEDDFHTGARPESRAARARRSAPSRDDTTLRTKVELASGTTMTALEMQWELYDLAAKYAAERGLEALGDEEVGRRVLDRWEAVLTASRATRSRLATQLDWVAKLRLIEAYRERHGLDWDDPRLAAHRPAVPRPATGQVALRPAGDGDASPTDEEVDAGDD